MAWLNEIELRFESLRFFEEFHEALKPTLPRRIGGQDLESYLEEIHSLDAIFGNPAWHDFLKKLKERCNDTHSKITESIVSWATKDLTEFEFYTRCCLLLIGRAELFQQLERCLFGGREEIRREMESWRAEVRRKAVRELDVQLGLCRSTISAMKDDGPEDLSLVQRELIEKECSLYLDYSAGTRWERSPRLNYSIVVPCLEEKEKALLAIYNYVLAYFEAVLSNTLL